VQTILRPVVSRTDRMTDNLSGFPFLPRGCDGNAFVRTLLCIFLVRALTFEILNPETSFWCAGMPSESLRSSSCIKVIGSRSTARDQKLDIIRAYN